MSKIEEVAKAIYETEPYAISMRKEMPWADVDESQKEGFRVKARAAIAEMRKPTPAMLTAGEATIFEERAEPQDWSLEATKEGYEAMIDAALKEQEDQPR